MCECECEVTKASVSVSEYVSACASVRATISHAGKKTRMRFFFLYFTCGFFFPHVMFFFACDYFFPHVIMFFHM